MEKKAISVVGARLWIEGASFQLAEFGARDVNKDQG